ncbi:unnamed protein product [Caenorhabditis brenneri]
MNERLKYSLNGVYQCENFAEHARQDNFPRVPIGSAGGIDGWYIMLRILEGSNPPVVYPFIFCNDKPALALRFCFTVIKKDRSSCFTGHECRITAPDHGPIGDDMRIMDLLNEENGYLDDNGGLTIEYAEEIPLISVMAQELNFPNVVKYCEQQLLERYYICSNSWFFWDKAMRMNSRTILSYLFREHPLKVFEEKLKNDVSIEKMSGEVMKTIVAKIFKEGF